MHYRATLQVTLSQRSSLLVWLKTFKELYIRGLKYDISNTNISLSSNIYINYKNSPIKK